jgi:hypothetical protein
LVPTHASCGGTDGFLPGVATLWQNHRFPDASAFVVELPAGPMSAAEVTRHVRAVHAMG